MAGRRITIEFLGKDSSAGKTAQAVEKRFGKLGSRLDKVGQQAGRALAGGLAMAGVAAYKAGQKASDLAETQSKVAQIFGKDSVAALERFAGGADKSMGQSKQTALDAAATFGMFGKSAGLAGDDLVGFSTDLTGLASDMASFNNTSPEQAIEAIGAALRGESEPIRSFGVMLNDATLKEEALRLGLIKTTKEALTPQQKVLAAQAAIYSQTKDQQGDFARTSDGLANKQRIMTAQFENLSAELGAKVLPAMLKLTDLGLKMIRWVDQNRTLVGALVVGLGGLAAVVWTVSAAMRAWIAITKVWKAITIVAKNVQLAFNLAMMMNPIGLVVIALIALAAGLVIAYKKSATFRGFIKKLWEGLKVAWDWIKRMTVAVGGALSAAFGKVSGFARDAWSAIRNTFTGGMQWLVDAVASIPTKIGRLAGRFTSVGKALIQAMIDGLKNAAGLVSDVAGSIWNAVKGLLNDAIYKINRSLEFSIPVPGKDIPINPPDIPALRTGTTYARGGTTLVGEDGPELVNLRPGAQVLNARRTAGLSGDSGTMVVILQLDGREIHRSLLKRKRDLGLAGLGLA